MTPEVEMGQDPKTLEPLFVDYKGAARITGFSRWTLARAVKERELTPIRHGRSVRFSVADLRGWLESKRAN